MNLQDNSNLNVTSELRSAVQHSRRFMKWIVLVVVLFYLSLGFYAIKANEEGVLEWMGSVVDKRVLPGLHYTFPWPFSRIYKVPVKKDESFVVADFFQDTRPDSRASIFYNLTGLESYALSGDNNAVEIKVIVQYRISDPFNYLFGASRKNTLLRDIICREIIHLLAVQPVDIILTSGKDAIKNHLQINAQKKLDKNETGLTIHRVDIEDIRPPSSVQAYFDDVINAKIDKEKMKSRAESYANEEIARARGEGNRKIQESLSYRDKATQSATGETVRFLAIFSEYRKVPKITRKRIYLEFARECLSQLKNTYLVDRKDGVNPVDLHILPGG